MKPDSTAAAQEAEVSPARFSRRVHITDPDAAFAELQAENDSLVEHIASLEARLPSTEELAYLRNRKQADDNAAWLWRVTKANAPWIAVVASGLGTLLYWLVTHTITIGQKP